MSEVKKAIIIGAGLGSRMYPYTKVESKLMTPVLNIPVIEYLIEELAKSGIEEVIIVSNHISKIQQFFRENERLNNILRKLGREDLMKKLHNISKIKFNYIQEEEPYGWLHEVKTAKKHLSKAPFAVLFSDILYDSKVPATKQIINEFERTGKNIRSNARFILKPNCYELIEEENFELGKDTTDLDFFEKLRAKNDLKFVNIKGEFLDTGEPYELLKTITYLALKNPQYKQKYKRFLRKLLGV